MKTDQELLGRINSATKYPSILTYHGLDPKNGKLIEGEWTHFGADTTVIATEKVDGTGARIIVTPDDDFFIGSREELIYAKGDRIETTELGIVAALKHLAPTLGGDAEVLRTFYLEVYGHRIGGNAKQYTGAGNTGFRLFDVSIVPMSILDLPREQVSSWRQHGGQEWLAENLLHGTSDYYHVPLVPRLELFQGRDLPHTLKDMQRFLTAWAPGTRVELDDGAKGRAEGIVLRTPDRRVIAKARFQDYERTLR